MPSLNTLEKELPLIQRGIVDSCFEEGQYEYGIDVLDKLRAQGYKPASLHIRQLLYIALYPPPRGVLGGVAHGNVPLSPQKARFQRQREDMWPKPESRPLAIALLLAYVDTNSPACLMRGLPFYSYTNKEGTKDVDPFPQEKGTSRDDSEEDNSPLKSELVAIESLKDCWGLLRDNFVKRKRFDRIRADEEDDSTEEDTTVGPYAWPVLEWLVRIFEKEEREEKASDHREAVLLQLPHSTILLRQIPQPRTLNGPRWDAEVPLQVAFACLSPVSPPSNQPLNYPAPNARSDLGIRLISMLTNLTMTQPPLLSPIHLLRSLTLRLFDLPLSSLQTFLSGIPGSQTLFKISAIESYLALGSRTGDEHMRKTAATVPRAKPRFKGNLKNTSETPAGTVTSSDTQSKYKEPYPLPSYQTLFTLIASPLSTASSQQSCCSKFALAKFHLISALWSYHRSGNLVDPQWDVAMRKDKLRTCIVSGFSLGVGQQSEHSMLVDSDVQHGSDEEVIKSYMIGALEMVKVWEKSLLK